LNKGYRGNGIKGPIKVTHAGQRPQDKKQRES